MIWPTKRALRPRIWLMLGATTLACIPQRLPPPAYEKRPELAKIRLFVPTKAELTWSDERCKEEANRLVVEYAQQVASELSRAGFSVTNTEKGVDAKVQIRATLSYCGNLSPVGDGSVGIDPGATASAGISDEHYTWSEAVHKLAQAPQVLALADKQPASANPTRSEHTVNGTASPATPSAPNWATGARQADAFALVIGVEKYRDVPAPVGARADAESFRALAIRTLGVPEANVRTLLDDHASKADIERELVWLKGNVPQDGKIFFYFAGHGAPDTGNGSAYLLPYDGSPEAVTETATALDVVLQRLSDTKARRAVAFVDACFSGAGGRSLLAKGARPLLRVKDVSTTTHVALFSASGASQISGPTPDGKAGLFTHTLLDALGNAQADIDGDGSITIEELSQWTTPRVMRAAQRQNREQSPSLTLPADAAAASFTLAYGIGKP